MLKGQNGRTRLVKILGIVSHIGSSLAENHVSEAALDRCFTRIEAWRRKNSEFQIEDDVAHLYKSGDLPLLLPDLAAANGILISANSDSLFHLAEFAVGLQALESEYFSLRGKWVGVIASGDGDDHAVANQAYQILVSCNYAGMLLPPKAFAYVKDLKGRDHLRLAIDLADQISHYYEWEGRAASARAA